MPHRSVIVTAAGLVLSAAPLASAQQPPPVVPVAAPAPSVPEFLPRFDFHLSAAALAPPQIAGPAGPADDERYSWDTHFGGSLDLIDYVAGRGTFSVDYEAVLGSEFRAFDPNQGNYMLEGALSGRVAGNEIAGVFHHVSRHLGDRPKRGAVAWNELGVRLLRRLSAAGTTVDVDAEAGRVVQYAFVDYRWIGELSVVARHPLGLHAGLFARGTGQVFGVDRATADRSTQTGGLAEAGVRLKGRAAAIELFGGFEQRIDAYPVERGSVHWAFAGFRIVSR